ncbi:hypothetical protein Patl1_07528 [Pistacia atlantica]|uniref:Uncharacterized protein n=1 Tax=Pistacia atlantica TaxID=434234 RepID=A0ACC1AGU3_9ROSI|nr:hypothetical protein Patl1_07528 [Pistacia atlantica]
MVRTRQSVTTTINNLLVVLKMEHDICMITIKSCPRRKYGDVSQKLLVVSQREDAKRTLSTYDFDQEAARNEMENMIILHEYPIAMVDHVGFRKFCSIMQPLFTVVCRRTIKKDIMKIYKVEKKSMEMLKNNLGRIAYHH